MIDQSTFLNIYFFHIFYIHLFHVGLQIFRSKFAADSVFGHDIEIKLPKQRTRRRKYQIEVRLNLLIF